MRVAPLHRWATHIAEHVRHLRSLRSTAGPIGLTMDIDFTATAMVAKGSVWFGCLERIGVWSVGGCLVLGWVCGVRTREMLMMLIMFNSPHYATTHIGEHGFNRFHDHGAGLSPTMW